MTSFLSKALQQHAKSVAAVKQPKDVIGALVEALSEPQPGRGFSPLHASDITKEGFCPRQVCLMDVLKKEPKPESPGAALRATFDVGKAIGKLVTDEWLCKRAWGHWVCPHCLTSRCASFYPGGVSCETGGECRWQYYEVAFMDGVYSYTGSIDLFLDLGGPLRLVELKIKAPDQFAELVAPDAEHRIRTALYLNLIANNEATKHYPPINTDEASILYVSRGHGKKHPEYGQVLPFREFTVKRDDDAVLPYLNKAAEVALYRAGKIKALPTRICPTSFCETANGCPVQAACWSGNYH